MDKLTILARYLEFKKGSVNSKDKIKDIERYVKKFMLSNDKPLSKFNENDFSVFFNSLEYSITTINNIKDYVKAFVKWNYRDWSSKFRNLDVICKRQKTQRTYEPEQMVSIEKFKKLVETEDDLMWKCFLLVYFYGGFRPSECCRLKWDQIYFEPEGATIKLRAGKTGKDFYKGLPKEVEHLLKEWKKINNNSEYVFPSPLKENCPIIAKTFCAKLKRLSKKALNEKIVPYQLRHSIATILYGDDKRKDDDTANQLGHTKSMKAVYMNLDEHKLKTKARSLWNKIKPLTQEERDELKQVKEELEELKKNSMTKEDTRKMVIEALEQMALEKTIKN